jgi:hypothetical protein
MLCAIVRIPAGLRFAVRLAIYDSELIPASGAEFGPVGYELNLLYLGALASSAGAVRARGPSIGGAPPEAVREAEEPVEVSEPVEAHRATSMSREQLLALIDIEQGDGVGMTCQQRRSAGHGLWYLEER